MSATPTTHQIGDMVRYHGSLEEHHGLYTVTAFNHYSGRYALKGCDGFTVGSTLHDVSPRSITAANRAFPWPHGHML